MKGSSVRMTLTAALIAALLSACIVAPAPVPGEVVA